MARRTGAAEWADDSHVAGLFDDPEAAHTADRLALPITSRQILTARNLIKQSQILNLIAKWRAEDGHDPRKGGRPRVVSDETVLTVMLAIALEGLSVSISNARNVVLRLRDHPQPSTRHAATRQERRRLLREWEAQNEIRRHARKTLGLPDDLASADAWYHRMHRSFRAILTLVNLDPRMQYHRRYTTEALNQIHRTRDHHLEAARLERLQTLTNALVWASFEATPKRLRDRWEGSVCIDATPITAAARGNARSATLASSEPDAWWYRRSHDPREPDGKRRDIVNWAWDLHLSATTPTRPTSDFPRIFTGMSLDQPSRRVAHNTQVAMANLLEHEVPRMFLVGDRAYLPGRDERDYQIPMAKAGYRLVGAQIQGQTGVQGAVKGALVIDGSLMCPAIPEDLRDIFEDVKVGKITPEVFQQRLDRRTKYLLKAVEHRPGGVIRYACPARGPSPTAKCPLARQCQQKRLQERATGDAGAAMAQLPQVKAKLTQILKPPTQPGPVCLNSKAITVRPEEAAKYRQHGPMFGTAGWHAIYTHPRQTIESKNRHVKRGDGSSAEDHTRRLMRGRHVQTVLIALLVVADNVLTIKKWMRGERQEAGKPTADRAQQQPDLAQRVAELLEDALAPPDAA